MYPKDEVEAEMHVLVRISAHLELRDALPVSSRPLEYLEMRLCIYPCSNDS